MNLNRQQRRKLNKETKTKLTDKQYKDFMQQANEETIKLEVNKKLDRIWTEIEKYLIESMRENRISEERIAKILAGVLEKTKKAHPEGSVIN